MIFLQPTPATQMLSIVILACLLALAFFVGRFTASKGKAVALPRDPERPKRKYRRRTAPLQLETPDA